MVSGLIVGSPQDRITIGQLRLASVLHMSARQPQSSQMSEGNSLSSLEVRASRISIARGGAPAFLADRTALRRCVVVAVASSSSRNHDDDAPPIGDSSAPASTPRLEDWEKRLWRALEQEPDARLGRRIVVVPDSATAYAVQMTCINAVDSRGQARRYLTARYAVPDGGLGTMLVAFAKDIDALANRQRDTCGELLDQAQGSHWYSFAVRVADLTGWSSFIGETVPEAEARGQFELGDPDQLLQLIGSATDPGSSAHSLASRDECLLLIAESSWALNEVTSIINDIPRGVLLVITYNPDRDLDSLTELIGPVAVRLPPYPGPPPQRLRRVPTPTAPWPATAPRSRTRSASLDWR